MKEVLTFFPLTIDNTMYAQYKSCPLKFFRLYVQHYQGAEAVDLVAGKAFAAGLEVTRRLFYVEGVDSEEAIDAGLDELEYTYGDESIDRWADHNKSCDKMKEAFLSYFEEYPLATDHIQPAKLEGGEAAIEYSFAIPLGIEHPTLGVDLTFVGRADMLAEYGGKLMLVDEKTTGNITKHFAATWETRSQFTGYCYGFQESGIPVGGAVVRGIGIYKTMIKHVETATGRSDFEIAIWKKNFTETVQDMVAKYKEWLETKSKHSAEVWDSSLADACMAYMRPCQFQDSCKSKNGERFLASEEQNIWLPHLHERKPLKEFLEELTEESE